MLPVGVPATPGMKIPAKVPCGGSVMRVAFDKMGAEICGHPEWLASALQLIERQARGITNQPAQNATQPFRTNGRPTDRDSANRR